MLKYIAAILIFSSSLCSAENVSLFQIRMWAESEIKILCHEIEDIDLMSEEDDYYAQQLIIYRMGKLNVFNDLIFLTEQE